VKYLVRPWRRPVARVLLLALAVGTAPVYCLAGEPPGPPRSTPTFAASIQTAVQHEVGRVPKVAPRAARQAGGASSAGPSSGSFFKSRAGIVTVVLLAVGTSFALYSTSHDRVTSPNQTYGGTK
jgi:hypothetical protein